MPRSLFLLMESSMQSHIICAELFSSMQQKRLVKMAVRRQCPVRRPVKMRTVFFPCVIKVLNLLWLYSRRRILDCLSPGRCSQKDRRFSSSSDLSKPHTNWVRAQLEGFFTPFLARLSASSFSGMLLCPGIYLIVSSFTATSLSRAVLTSRTSLDVILALLSAFMAAILSGSIAMSLS